MTHDKGVYTNMLESFSNSYIHIVWVEMHEAIHPNKYNLCAEKVAFFMCFEITNVSANSEFK